MIALVVLVVVIVAAVAVGLALKSRDGRIRDRRPTGAVAPVSPELAAVGVGGGNPVILHFSAPWCGPCAAVRRVLARVVEDAAVSGRTILDVELDLDGNPAAAGQLGVLSLPTTFVFDAAGRERFRVSGVPTATDVARALESL